MADLSKVKRPNRLAVLKKVQEQPMPPARVPLNNPIASEAKTDEPALEAPAQPQEKPEATKPVLPPEPKPEKVEPAADDARPSPANVSRYRFSLQFDDPALKAEAEAVAKAYGVPLAHIIKAIASEVQIVADDFQQAPGAARGALRPGGSVRVELSMDKKGAETWLKLHDPLGVQSASIVLRPVAIRAFERAAPRKLAALKKEK